MIGYDSWMNFILWIFVVWIPMIVGWQMYDYGIDYSYCIAASGLLGVAGGYIVELGRHVEGDPVFFELPDYFKDKTYDEIKKMYEEDGKEIHVWHWEFIETQHPHWEEINQANEKLNSNQG